MDLNKKIELQQEIINDLTKEIEELKAKVEDLEFEKGLFNSNHQESLDRANKLILECSEKINTFNELNSSLVEIKKQYKEATKEIYQLKAKYKNEYEDFKDTLN